MAVPDHGAEPAGADRPGPSRSVDWLSAHICYHGPLDLVLTDLVVPLVRELWAEHLIEDFFFLRYWDGGPHVRLRLRPGVGGPAPVRSLVDRCCREFFWKNPAPETLDPDTYPAWAAALAAAEGVRDYRPTPYPNHTLVQVPYRPEYRRYGRGPAMAVVERHFGESSRIALALLCSGGEAQRAAAAVGMLVSAWLVVPLPRERLRQYAAAGDSGEFDRHRVRLLGIVARAAAAVRGEGQRPAPGWASSVTALRDGLAAAGTGKADRSRIIDLCAHLVCNRLGLAASDERRLRALAARALHEWRQDRSSGAASNETEIRLHHTETLV